MKLRKKLKELEPDFDYSVHSFGSTGIIDPLTQPAHVRMNQASRYFSMNPQL